MFKFLCLKLLLSAFFLSAHAWAFDPLRVEKSLPPAISPNNENLMRGEFFTCPQTLPQTPLSALDIVDLALCHNPQTRSIWAAAQLQAFQLAQSKSKLLPDLNANLNLQQNRGQSQKTKSKGADVSLSWLLLDFGTRRAEMARDELLLQAALHTENNAVQTLIQTALLRFYTAKANEAAVLAAKESEKFAQESWDAAKNRYEVGVGTPADQLQAQTAYSEATLKRITAEGNLQTARGNLLNAIGFEPTQSFTLAKIPELPRKIVLEKEIHSVIQTALTLRPDLKAKNLQSQAAQKNIRAVRAAGLPTLNLSASENWNSRFSPSPSVFNRTGTIGLSVNIPLFTGFSRHYLIKDAKTRYESALAEEDLLKNQVALDVWQAYQNLLTAIQSLKATNDLIKSAQQSANVALGRYKAGVGNILDVLSAQSSLADARLQKIQAELNWHSYRIDFAKAAGTLNYQSLNNTASLP